MFDPELARAACRSLVDTINRTGGLVDVAEGDARAPAPAPILVPGADRDWDDLADAYLAACRALGEGPTIAGPAPEVAT